MRVHCTLFGLLMLVFADESSGEGFRWLPWLIERPSDSPWSTIPFKERIAVSEIERLIWDQDAEVLAEITVRNGCRYYAMSRDACSGVYCTDIVLYAAGENDRFARRQSFVTLRYPIAKLAFESTRLQVVPTLQEDEFRLVDFPLLGCGSR